MATNYPANFDTSTTLPAEAAAVPLSTNHVTAHQNLQDSMEAVQAKVGVDGSAVTTTHDYKLSEVTSTDKAVSKTATQTLTNKTLTSPVISNPVISNPTLNLTSGATGDMYYNGGSGVVTRLAAVEGKIVKVVGGVPTMATETTVVDATYTVKGIQYLDADAQYYAADAGSTDTYVVTMATAPNAYAVGQTFKIKPNTTNTGAATVNINSLGAKTIVKEVSSTLSDGDMQAGTIYTIIYDGTNFVLQNALPSFVSLVVNIPTSSTSVTVTHNLGVIPRYAYIRSSNFKVSTGTSHGVGYANWNKSTGVLVRQNFTGYNLDSNGGVVSFLNTASGVADVSGSGNGCTASVGTTTSSSFTLTFGASASGTSTDFYIEVYA